MILSSAPRAARAARGVREVAKPPSGIRGSRRLPKGKEQRRWSSALPVDWNAGVFQRTVRLPAYTKHTKRSRAATCTGDYCTDVAAHAPEDRLKGESQELFRAWVSRRSGVIDSCLLDKLALARGQVPLYIVPQKEHIISIFYDILYNSNKFWHNMN